MNHELTHPISRALLPIVRGMCYHPEDLAIKESRGNSVLEIQFFAHKADMPILIGKAGRQAAAFRKFGLEAGKRSRERVDISFFESGIGEPEPNHEFIFNPLFSKAELDELLDPLIKLAFGRTIHCEFEIEGGIFKVKMEVEEAEVLLAKAIGDMIFPLGKTQGRRIEVKPKREFVT